VHVLIVFNGSKDQIQITIKCNIIKAFISGCPKSKCERYILLFLKELKYASNSETESFIFSLNLSEQNTVLN